MNLIEAIEDPNLFGAHPAFAEPETWQAWFTFLRCFHGEPLDGEDIARFRKATGRTRYAPPKGGYMEAALILGRQSGKSRVASAMAVADAAFSPPAAAGERLYSLLVAQDERGAKRTLLDYARALTETSPLLGDAVANTTREQLEFKNGHAVTAYPCNPRAVRGIRANLVILDEIAFFRSTDGYPVDKEMLRAVRPLLATTGGRLLILSSPHAQHGALWDIYRRHYGRDESPVLVWQSDARSMNPTLSKSYTKRMQEEDPEAYASEVGGEFRAGLSTLFDPDALDACVATDRLEVPPGAGIRYHAFVDPSGGRRDSFTLAIGHRDGERGVVDLAREWKAPFQPSNVVKEISTVCREYRVTYVVGDRYAGAWPAEAFGAVGLSYRTGKPPASDLYLGLLSYVNSRSIELPDSKSLLAQLRGLERRAIRGGRDRVDHVPGAHDDVANAVAGVASLVMNRGAGSERCGIKF